MSVFLPFDEERYSLASDGSYETLTSDMFALIAGVNNFKSITLRSKRYWCHPNCYTKKIKPRLKDKKKYRVSSVVISASKNAGSGIGATTLDDGLVYGSFHLELEFRIVLFALTFQILLIFMRFLNLQIQAIQLHQKQS